METPYRKDLAKAKRTCVRTYSVFGSSRYSDWLRAGRPGGQEFESRYGQKIFTSPYRPDRLWGPPNVL
jgi:hypothetical protein